MHQHDDGDEELYVNFVNSFFYVDSASIITLFLKTKLV